MIRSGLLVGGVLAAFACGCKSDEPISTARPPPPSTSEPAEPEGERVRQFEYASAKAFYDEYTALESGADVEKKYGLPHESISVTGTVRALTPSPDGISQLELAAGDSHALVIRFADGGLRAMNDKLSVGDTLSVHSCRILGAGENSVKLNHCYVKEIQRAAKATK